MSAASVDPHGYAAQDQVTAQLIDALTEYLATCQERILKANGDDLSKWKPLHRDRFCRIHEAWNKVKALHAELVRTDA